MMGCSPWPPGVSESVLGVLLNRLSVRPEIATVLVYRAKKRIELGEKGDFACTYNGDDPTEDLMMYLADALIAFERVRREVMAPLHDSPGVADPRFSSLAAELLPLETMLVESIARSVSVNNMAWIDMGSRGEEKA